MRSLRTLTAFGLLLLLAGHVFGQGLIIIDGPDTMLPREHWPRRGCLELRRHQVQVEIHDQVASTTVEHVFYNPTSRQLEGHFVFPLLPGAQIDQVLMDVNGEQVEAELLEAGKARRIYEDIVRQLRDPALLEYCDDGLIRARVFPIEPNSEKRITITYTQLLPADNDLISYEYPLTEHRVEGAPVTKLVMKIDLQTTEPLATIYSPTHEMEIQRKGKHRAVVGLEQTGGSNTSGGGGTSGVQLLFACQRDQDKPALKLMTYNDGREDGYFMLLASPPAPEGDHAETLPKTVLFVLDTSGSMAGEKLAQAKRALRYCLNILNDNDTFQLIRFATDVEPLFDSPVAVTDKRRKQAQEFVDDLKAVGGTAIDDALAEAIQQAQYSDAGGADYIVFLTDGRPTVGQTDPDQIVKAIAKRQDNFRGRIFCFGIGTDINTKLLDRITQTTRAASQYVLPEEDLELKLSNFYAKIDQPVLADPVLEADGVKISQWQPRDLPDLFRGEQMIVFGRYRGDGDATLTLTGQQVDQTIVCEQTVKFAEKNMRHDFIPRMWATRRVGFLLDEIRLHGESKELKDEVVTLARKFGILTPYTSYLIVEDERQRAVPVAQQTLPRISQDDTFREFVTEEYSQMKMADTGRMGIAANRQNDMLSRAHVAQATSMAVASGSAKPQAAMATQVVNGRAFVRNGKQWIDSNVQQLKDPPMRQINFASDDYFALLRDHPETAQWLSVGRNVVFQLGDEVIEIVSGSDD
ncbi:MAG: VWA domain-containing protein [Phycisphaeraceae bacterium]|nr:VWA domain-containing protein [Phycisphaeraceae bacterium]